MKRNIIATVEFSNGQVAFNVLERLSSSIVEIYSKSDLVSKANSFLAEAKDKVERMIGGSLNDVTVVCQPSSKVDQKINLVSESIAIAHDKVTKQDVDNLIELVRRKNIQPNREITLIQPLQFEVKDLITKKYSKAPIDKKGETLSAVFAVTTVSQEIVEFAKNIVTAQKLNISQILLTTQTITQNNLSDNALAVGSILMHTNENQSSLSIVKNHGTVASMSFYDSGLKQLLLGISKMFGCDVAEARELLSIYGSFKEKGNRVIYTHQEGIKETHHTNTELTEILKTFTRRMVTLAKKFIDQKNVNSLPIVFSGELSKVEGFYEFVNEIIEMNMSIFKPLTYIEHNSALYSIIGVSKFESRMAEVLGKTFTSIVETNPNTIASLKKTNQNKKLWDKLVDTIGGKYDWN